MSADDSSRPHALTIRVDFVAGTLSVAMDGAEQPPVVTVDNGEVAAPRRKAGRPAGRCRADCIIALHQAGTPIGPAEVHRRLPPERGYELSTVKSVLKHLAAAGTVVPAGNGTYALPE